MLIRLYLSIKKELPHGFMGNKKKRYVPIMEKSDLQYEKLRFETN